MLLPLLLPLLLLLLLLLLLSGLLGHLPHLIRGLLLFHVVRAGIHLLNDLVQLLRCAGEHLFRLRVICVKGKTLQVTGAGLQLADRLVKLCTGRQVAHLLHPLSWSQQAPVMLEIERFSTKKVSLHESRI